MELMEVLRAWWCQKMHGSLHQLVTKPGEVFLRCERCGFRSPGLETGPLRVRSFLPGNPEHHVMKRFKAKVLVMPRRDEGESGERIAARGGRR